MPRYRVNISNPTQKSCHGLDESNLNVKHVQGCTSTLNGLSDPSNVSLLYEVLHKMVMHHHWEETIDLQYMHFEWEFDGHCYESSNPFVELFFRCIRMLGIMFNDSIQGEDQCDQVDLERVVRAMNMAIKGSIAAVPYCQDFVVAPALLMPPCLRPSHDFIFDETNLEIVPGLSTHTIQVMVYMVVTQVWINTIVDDVKMIRRHPNLYTHCREQNISQIISLLGKVIDDVFLTDKNPLRKQDDYARYIDYIHDMVMGTGHSIKSYDSCHRSKSELVNGPSTNIGAMEESQKDVVIFGNGTLNEGYQRSIISEWKNHSCCDFSVGSFSKRRYEDIDCWTTIRSSSVRDEKMSLLENKDEGRDGDGCCVIL